MLSLDRFLSWPSLVLGPRAGRAGLEWIPWACGRDIDDMSGDMFVCPVMGECWVAESSESVVGAVDGDMLVSTFSPAVSHIEGCCAELPAKKG
jgi:hypothetical protein